MDGEKTAMKYIMPEYYGEFRCLDKNCPDSCCKGWQISIDAETLKKYSNLEGPFANRLKNSVDWENGCFCQYQGSCVMLNEQGLCDIYTEAGPSMLCGTCRDYPRHREEYEGVVELSLSLSCAEAARIILEHTGPLFQRSRALRPQSGVSGARAYTGQGISYGRSAGLSGWR